ncbi:MAG: hypothetical protein WC248_01980 [Candidatus Methanomethylophilaceae archaeon]|jgi:hypothetical protein
MNVLHATLKLFVILISLSLLALVVLAVYPVATGGLNVTQDEELTIETDPTIPIYFDITGQFTITSTMPYDINDVNPQIYMESADKSVRVDLYNEGEFTVPSNGSHTVIIDTKVLIPELLLFLIVDNQSSTSETGMYLPLTVEVGGSYMQNMMRLDINADIDAKVVDSGHVENTVTEYSGGNLIKITCVMTDVEGTLVSMIPEFDMTISDCPVEISVTVTEKTDGRYDIAFIVNSTDDSDIIDDLNSSTIGGMTINVSVNGSEPIPIFLNETTAKGFVTLIEKTMGAA